MVDNATLPVIKRAHSLARAEELWNVRTTAPRPIRSWNGGGWFVVLKIRHFCVYYRRQHGSAVEAVELFHDIQSLKRSDEMPFVVSICLYLWPHSRRFTVNAPNNWPPPRQPKLGSASRSTFNGTPDNLPETTGSVSGIDGHATATPERVDSGPMNKLRSECAIPTSA